MRSRVKTSFSGLVFGDGDLDEAVSTLEEYPQAPQDESAAAVAANVLSEIKQRPGPRDKDENHNHRNPIHLNGLLHDQNEEDRARQKCRERVWYLLSQPRDNFMTEDGGPSSSKRRKMPVLEVPPTVPRPMTGVVVQNLASRLNLDELWVRWGVEWAGTGETRSSGEKNGERTVVVVAEEPTIPRHGCRWQDFSPRLSLWRNLLAEDPSSSSCQIGAELVASGGGSSAAAADPAEGFSAAAAAAEKSSAGSAGILLVEIVPPEQAVGGTGGVVFREVRDEAQELGDLGFLLDGRVRIEPDSRGGRKVVAGEDMPRGTILFLEKPVIGVLTEEGEAIVRKYAAGALQEHNGAPGGTAGAPPSTGAQQNSPEAPPASKAATSLPSCSGNINLSPEDDGIMSPEDGGREAAPRGPVGTTSLACGRSEPLVCAFAAATRKKVNYLTGSIRTNLPDEYLVHRALAAAAQMHPFEVLTRLECGDCGFGFMVREAVLRRLAQTDEDADCPHCAVVERGGAGAQEKVARREKGGAVAEGEQSEEGEESEDDASDSADDSEEDDDSDEGDANCRLAAPGGDDADENLPHNKNLPDDLEHFLQTATTVATDNLFADNFDRPFAGEAYRRQLLGLRIHASQDESWKLPPPASLLPPLPAAEVSSKARNLLNDARRCGDLLRLKVGLNCFGFETLWETEEIPLPAVSRGFSDEEVLADFSRALQQRDTSLLPDVKEVFVRTLSETVLDLESVAEKSSCVVDQARRFAQMDLRQALRVAGETLSAKRTTTASPLAIPGLNDRGTAEAARTPAEDRGGQRKRTARTPAEDLHWCGAGAKRRKIDADRVAPVVGSTHEEPEGLVWEKLHAGVGSTQRTQSSPTPAWSFSHTSPSGTGLFFLSAMLNHSCAPNCHKFFLGDIAFFATLREVKAGEELCHSYLPPDGLVQAARERSARLDRDFVCCCERCEGDADHEEDSDSEMDVDLEELQKALAELPTHAARAEYLRKALCGECGEEDSSEEDSGGEEQAEGQDPTGESFPAYQRAQLLRLYGLCCVRAGDAASAVQALGRYLELVARNYQENCAVGGSSRAEGATRKSARLEREISLAGCVDPLRAAHALLASWLCSLQLAGEDSGPLLSTAPPCRAGTSQLQKKSSVGKKGPAGPPLSKRKQTSPPASASAGTRTSADQLLREQAMVFFGGQGQGHDWLKKIATLVARRNAREIVGLWGAMMVAKK